MMRRGFCLLLTLAISLMALTGVAPPERLGLAMGGQGSAPSTLPLLEQSDFSLLGYFELPEGTNPYPNGSGNYSQSDFTYAGGWVAAVPGTSTLYIGGMDNGSYAASSNSAGTVGIINIPTDLSGDATATMNTYLNASNNQQIMYPINTANTDGFSPGTYVVEGGATYVASLSTLVATYWWFFPSNDDPQTVNAVSLAGNFSSGPDIGLQLGISGGNNHLYSGALGTLGTEWAAYLGYTNLEGMQQTPIDQSDSFGPSAFTFNAASVANETSVTPVRALVYYPLANPIDNYFNVEMLSNLQSNSDTTTAVFNPSGTRTLVVLGIHGEGAYCYGTGSGPGTGYAEITGTISSGTPNEITGVTVVEGTIDTSMLSNETVVGPTGISTSALPTISSYSDGTITLSANATTFGTDETFYISYTSSCFDPVGSGHGEHSYPYVYYAWLYDLNDLLPVFDGSEDSWVPQPYATFALPQASPIASGMVPGGDGGVVGAASYDPSTGRVYWYMGQTTPAYMQVYQVTVP